MTFEFDGDKYKAASSHQKEWGTKVISELNLKGNEKVLDLGCGDGVLTVQLAEHIPSGFVLGIDASKGMINAAKKNKRHNFKLMDINQIEFKDEFDLVFSNAALHWIKDHELLLFNVYNSMKPGGIVSFNFAADGNCSNFFKVIRDVIKSEEYKTHFNNYEWPWYMPDIKEYKKVIDKFPFKESRVWCENADRFFPDADTMIKWIDQPSIVPFLKYIEKEKKMPFRNTVVEQMLKTTVREDGTYFETFRRINLFARK